MNIGIGGVVVPETKKVNQRYGRKMQANTYVKFNIDRSSPVIKASMILFCHVQSSLSNASPLL